MLTKSPSTDYKKSKSEINDINYQQKIKIVRQVLSNKIPILLDSENIVGPGSYNVNFLDKKVAFKIHETNIDRFG